MSSHEQPQRDAGLPEDMATPVVSLKDLGQMIAQRHAVGPGLYELVVQYRFGLGRLAEEDGPVGAMAITFGGLGLRPAEKASAMTIEVLGEGEKAADKAASRKAPAKNPGEGVKKGIRASKKISK